MIYYKQGNLIDLAEAGEFNVIVHGCNCFNTFGSGLAKEIKARYPEAYKADLYTVKGDRFKLGGYTLMLGKRFNIINAYTQYDYGNDGKDRFEYDRFKSILQALSFKYQACNFGFPKIGSQRAGGDWNRIEKLLEDFSACIDGTVTVCTL